MGAVRAFSIDDVPLVANLYQRIYGASAASVEPAFGRYIEQVYFRNPWRDLALPSLVYQDESGRLVGFLGVIPRQMIMKGQPIRVAISTSFMVNPDRRHTMAGMHLLRALFSGPQDLTLTDGANDFSRAVWERLGGIAVPLYSMDWTRVLRPGRYGLQLLERRRQRLQALTDGLRPLCAGLDLVAARIRPNRFTKIEGPDSHDESLDVTTHLGCIEKFSQNASLQPLYNAESLPWLLGMAVQKEHYGHLDTSIVRNLQRDIVGCYVWYQKPKGESRVFQLMSVKQSIHQVLHHLFRNAWRRGSVSVSGRIEPHFIPELSENYCLFHAGCWMLVHSSHAEILQAICRGDAFLSQLEGERWARFLEFVH